MNPDWLWISLIASLAGAITLAFILIDCKLDERAGRKAERILRDLADEADRVVRHGDQHPWMDR